jgi:DNA repair protein RadC
MNMGTYEQKAQDLGKLVDLKQKSYGNSITKTNELLEVFLSGYDNGDNTYTIPKSLLHHIGLMVRVIDKQNRIFSNPDGDLMSENPYLDISGYGLLGDNLIEPSNS